MRSLPLVMCVLLACQGAEPDWLDANPWSWQELLVEVPPAFDPKLDGDVGLDVVVRIPAALPDGCTVDVAAVSGSGQVVPLGVYPASTAPQGLSIPWNGTDADGLPVDPGPVQITADLSCFRQIAGFGQARTYAVRLGAGAVDLGVLADADKSLLAWHKTDVRTQQITVVPHDLIEWRRDAPAGALADLDDDAGEPRPAPEPWTDPSFVPWGAGTPEDLSSLALPVAYTAGAGFSVAFWPGTAAVSMRSGGRVDARGPLAAREDLPVIRVLADGLDAVGEAAWTPGAPATFRSAGLRMPDTLGRHDLSITWRFEALRDGAWEPLAGTVTTVHPVYVLAGPTAVQDGADHGASPSASWVGVLEDVRPAVQGLPATDLDAVLDALRQELHQDPWIRYNPNDSAYSTFQGRYIYWDRIWAEMSDYLDRQQGIELYCHSVACILSSQANHLGIEAEYITIVNEDHPTSGATFSTFLTRAAGTEPWRPWTFNSHGIVRFDDRVWDAAVDIDGDDDPRREPVTPVAPMGLSFEAYTELLTANRMTIVNHGRCDNY